MLLFLMAFLLAALRAMGVKSPIYQAVAHLFQGYLLGRSLGSKGTKYLWLALGLVVVEIVSSLAFFFLPDVPT